MSWLFKIALGLDGIAVLVGLYFIFSDAFSSPYSKSSGIVMVALLMCGWMGLCYYLFTHQYPVLATIMAWLPLVPILLYAGFVLMIVKGKADFK